MPLVPCSPRASLAQLCADGPARAVLLERFGLAPVADGVVSLEAACAHAGLDPDLVAAAIDVAEAPLGGPEDETNWRAAPLADLIGYLLKRYHHPLRQALPRLGALVDRLVETHGLQVPELQELSGHFYAFWGHMALHLDKEEALAFNAIERAERAAMAKGDAPPGPPLAPSITALEADHAAANGELAAMRAATSGYRASTGAGPAAEVLLAALATLEGDIARHVRLEEEILFPRALALATTRVSG